MTKNDSGCSKYRKHLRKQEKYTHKKVITATEQGRKGGIHRPGVLLREYRQTGEQTDT